MKIKKINNDNGFVHQTDFMDLKQERLQDVFGDICPFNKVFLISKFYILYNEEFTNEYKSKILDIERLDVSLIVNNNGIENNISNVEPANEKNFNFKIW